MKLIDMAGKRFGRLNPITREGSIRGSAAWRCLCDCGNYCIVKSTTLQNGHTKSCGCLKKDTAKIRATKHGLSKTKEYPVWAGMKERCHNPKSPFYSYYGGRGITVCERWMTFENFLADMGPRPSLKYSIDRIDNDGNYEPGNCRWATSLDQSNNTSRNVFITINGEKKTMTQWCLLNRIDPALACQRIRRHGWLPEDAVTKLVRAKSPASE